ncbi:MAG TPA: hypothetical protein VN380_10165 [Thermoanaerobaculia bacterium]|jgi:hypothetical protein|nr:hypothetical protein [Thermoanaerobaculia bacterium]
MLDVNPMYYGTLAFLAFSSCFIIPGLFLAHSLKKAQKKKRHIGFITSGPESRSRSAE